jgi:ferrous iron transport protein B
MAARSRSQAVFTEDAPIRVALAGNPNSGKTTLFNAITGARQHVGNYPGVTVEKIEGTARVGEHKLDVVDLPGTYSLTAYSIEEVVARNVLLEEPPDVVVDILDASNLERHLYLATQLIELGIPLVLAMNMSDVAAARGMRTDVDLLSRLLGVPIVETVGHRGEGVEGLLQQAALTARNGKAAVDRQRHPNYGEEIESHLAELTALLREAGLENHLRWFAVKLLEGDAETLRRLREKFGHEAEALLAEADRIRSHVETLGGDSAPLLLADRRYGFISGAVTEATALTAEIRHDRSDKIDAVLINRYLGLPIFAVLMYLVFQLTFTAGQYPMQWIEAGFGALSEWIVHIWPDPQSLLRSFVVDGLIGGVGGVIIFLPNILLLFLAIAFLEGTGYMARAAFIMDRLMHRIGLHGKSFIPLLIGFGCTVPAIMATRTIETRRDRLTTILIAPLMSCGARLPIYSLLIPAFFAPAWRAPMLWLIYLIGIALAVAAAKVLRKTVLRGESTPFVMELPPYRMPTVRAILLHMWQRSWMYLRKAGTVILAFSIILWALTTFPRKPESPPAPPAASAIVQPEASEADAADTPRLPTGEARPEKESADEETRLQTEQLTYSAAGRIGHTMEPVLRPMGFDWKIGTALIGAFAAKEIFVAQLGIVYSVGEAEETPETLRKQLNRAYTPLQGFCIMLFCLISMPCMATVAVTARESGSWKWALLQLTYLTVLAWVITTAVYQVGTAIVSMSG